MQSDVSHSHSKVDVSAAVGGHYKHVTANQDGTIRAVECLGSRGCLCLSTVSPLQLLRPSSTGTSTGGVDRCTMHTEGVVDQVRLHAKQPFVNGQNRLGPRVLMIAVGFLTTCTCL